MQQLRGKAGVVKASWLYVFSEIPLAFFTKGFYKRDYQLLHILAHFPD